MDEEQEKKVGKALNDVAAFLKGRGFEITEKVYLGFIVSKKDLLVKGDEYRFRIDALVNYGHYPDWITIEGCKVGGYSGDKKGRMAWPECNLIDNDKLWVKLLEVAKKAYWASENVKLEEKLEEDFKKVLEKQFVGFRVNYANKHKDGSMFATLYLGGVKDSDDKVTLDIEQKDNKIRITGIDIGYDYYMLPDSKAALMIVESIMALLKKKPEED